MTKHMRDGLARSAVGMAVAALLAACGSLPSQGGPSLAWVAGSPGSIGNLDGTGTAARFAGSLHVHGDGRGNVMVVDGDAATIRELDAQGRVSTLAGKAGVQGDRDGPVAQARFASPGDALRAADGTVYVADSDNGLIRAIHPDGSVSTVAGVRAPADGDGDSGDRDGVRDVARFDNPDQLVLDGAGRLWVHESSLGGVRIVDPDGTTRTWAPPSENGTVSLLALAAAPDGTIWGTDGATVGRVTPGGYTPLAASVPPAAMPNKAAGAAAASDASPDAASPATWRTLAFDGHGTLYAATDGAITAFDTSGKRGATITMRDAGNLQSLAFDAAGRMLVTNGGDAVLEVQSDGRTQPHAGLGEGDAMPGGDPHLAKLPDLIDDDFAVAPDHTIFYVSMTSDVVYRIAPDGHTELWAGARDRKGDADGPRLAARFHYPSGIALDRAGNLYVADSGNARIRRIDPSGQVTTVCGGRSDRQRVDGPFAQATFWQPDHLRLDAEGRLYVLDGSPYVGGHGGKVRRLDFSAGTVTTVADEARQIGITRDEIGRIVSSRRMPDTYEDLAIGPHGELYVLSGDVLWQIDPATGQHRIHFVPGPWPAAEHAYYQALVDAKSEREKRRRTNDMVGHDWVWARPERIAADALGNVYLSDGGNHTIVRVDPQGHAAIVAGQVGLRGNRMGPLPGVLNDPSALLIGPAGELFVNLGRRGIARISAPDRAMARQPVPPAEPLKLPAKAPVEPPAAVK